MGKKTLLRTFILLAITREADQHHDQASRTLQEGEGFFDLRSTSRRASPNVWYFDQTDGG